MATVIKRSTSKPLRQYGKKGNFNSANVSSFFSESEDDDMAAQMSLSEHQPSVKSSYHVRKRATASDGVEPGRRKMHKKDTFDPPSSDEDSGRPIGTVPKPARFVHKQTLVDDTKSCAAGLATWETQQAGHYDGVGSDHPTATTTSTMADPDTYEVGSSRMRSSTKGLTPRLDKKSDQTSPMSPASRIADRKAVTSSAALAVRKSDYHAAKTKRSTLIIGDAEESPRKRARMMKSSTASHDDDDHDDDDVMAYPSQYNASYLEAREVDAGDDFYDLQASSEDNSTLPYVKHSPSLTTKPLKSRRSGVKPTRVTPRKDVPAPTRLASTIPNHSDAMEPQTGASRSRGSTRPATPPPLCAESLDTTRDNDVTMTPRQKELWSKLLSAEGSTESPSSLPIQSLDITQYRRSAALRTKRILVTSKSDFPRRRTRLVDRLKAAAPSSDGEDIDEKCDLDQNTEDSSPAQEHDAPSIEALATHEDVTVPKALHRSTSLTGGGPKVTYARTRSYLPEESFEDDLVAGFALDTPKPPLQGSSLSKSMTALQKPAFDLTDSDSEENGPGKIRTIHELRASGRNVSGMYDIEELMRDIGNHSTSHRSRRRSALIELGTKVMNKSFAARLVAHGFDAQLKAECNATSDEVVDFVLVAVMALIMVSEPPEHIVSSLCDRCLVSWLVELTSRNTEVIVFAKARHNNMSKAAQESLLEFCDTLKKQNTLWGQHIPSVLTTRLIALATLDHFVTKLRGMGHHSDLLSTTELEQILPKLSQCPNESQNLDAAFSISILESLSTTLSSATWPETVVAHVQDTLIGLKPISPSQRQTLFLNLRLCLNLTNGNTRNCKILTLNAATVTYLMSLLQHGFENLDSELDDESGKLALDLLVLAMGIMINLTESCDEAQQQATHHTAQLSALVTSFHQGQKQMLHAESVEESVSNVAFGYLAVMLANLCQHAEAARLIAAELPGRNLDTLIEAVAEFVRHHEKVDTMNFGGAEGREVWGAFTEKLNAVLARLRSVGGSTAVFGTTPGLGDRL